jgi:hypothetical protein
MLSVRVTKVPSLAAGKGFPHRRVGNEKMLDIAERDPVTLGELIEKAIEAYEH